MSNADIPRINIDDDVLNINVEEDNVYAMRQVADVPFWYHSLVSVFLTTLGILGTSLNGFVIWSFAFRQAVSMI